MRVWRRSVLVVAMAVAVLGGSALTEGVRPKRTKVTATAARSDGAEPVVAAEAYDRRPLAFEAHVDQTDSQVAFSAQGRGYGVFVTPTEAVFSLRSPSRSAVGGLRLRPVGGRATAVWVSSSCLGG